MPDDPGALMDLAHRATKLGRPEIERQRTERLAEAVAHARARSRYFRELYAGLRAHVDDVTALPVTDKERLMERFDDWVTDPDITLEAVKRFVNEPARAGEIYRDGYTVATTTGTSGQRGIFLSDTHTWAVSRVIGARRTKAMFGGPLRAASVRLRGGRSTSIVATHGHYAAYSMMRQRLRDDPKSAKRSEILSVISPIDELVDHLNARRPALLTAYASVAALLAAEQEAGRLRISPTIVALAAEGLADTEYERIGRAFGCRAYNMYSSSESLVLAATCSHGWFHINEDWLYYEPVDADGAPTPPGEPSHTVLLSVLYRREQPILRYDLGDSVTVRPDGCPCGSPFLAVKVNGRACDGLRLTNADGEVVPVAAVAVVTTVERTVGVDGYQVIQTEPSVLEVRLRVSPGADAAAVWDSVCDDLRSMLDNYDLVKIAVARSAEPPERSPGGKHRKVVPLQSAT
ncbi:MAG TPA: hypothetical protein VE172_00660 [Stackebrandtia sp.]|jgi:phenylacetate-coenzyme A ligase PaaK-like adenylate-forming protein|uniref:hypothetical protein n=1 Tax=Stackebrandtia sp. TaxID=2023065 RepID=UPI002D4997CA|nr:hypothetical protein [Stackebrandtia sp.]HZE37300.1 hypothetical protein [Stackebrandtia sp.]